jgi:DNA-binding transcriptional LysR family regulator
LDRLEAMMVLLAAVDSGSFSKASKKLGLPLATVSRKVAELEKHLKANLLIRSAKGLELTTTGRTYVTGAKAILEHLNEVERAAAGEYIEPKGDLVVTAPIMFGRMHVLPAVTQFLGAYPDVAVGLRLTDRVTHFLDDQVDVAVRIGSLPDSSLVATRLGEVRRVVCAGPAYLASRGTPASPGELVHHALVSFEGVSTTSSWTFQIDGVETPVTFRSRLSVNTIDAAIDAGLANAGIVRAMSYQVAELVHSGKLVVILEAFEPLPRPVHLVYAGQSRLPLKLRAFIDFVVPRLREHLTHATLSNETNPTDTGRPARDQA